jgi:predicted PurR-regulated permease PerM
LSLGILAAFSWMVRLVVTPVLIAAVFAIVLWPIAARVSRRLGNRARLAPALVTAAALIGILGPAALIGTLTVLRLRSVKGSGFASTVEAQAGALIKLVQRAGRPLSSLGVDLSTDALRAWLEGQAQSLLGWLAGLASELLALTPDLLVGVLLFVIALYFWLRDGQAALEALRRALPFTAVETDGLFAGVRDASRAVLISEVGTGALQSLLALAFLAALGVPGAFLWGVLAFGLSFIPVFGTAPVTVGAVVYLLVCDRQLAALVMAGGVLLIGVSDNLVRPLLASGSANLHPLLVLLAIFGGLAALGPSGVFFGPILAALAVWALGFQGRSKAP